MRAPSNTDRCLTHPSPPYPAPLGAAQVRIVREKNTGKIMAMKKLKKSEMLRRGQVGERGGGAAGSIAQDA